MTVVRALLLVLVLVSAGCVSPTPGSADGAGLPEPDDDVLVGQTGHVLEGRPSPDYVGTDLNGDEVKLSGFDGGVLLHIWASWCTICEWEEDSVKSLFETHGSDVTFISVSIDEARYESAMRREAAEGVGLQWWDEADKIRPLFQVSYQPVTIFIDHGTIDTVWQGQRGDKTTLRGNEDTARILLDRIAAS